ncbi:hypothetical protein PtA15_15A185 [Puccinia triticina]|uniref:Uncharacterized protein n=1 Tax=Puccinia triticina TaxID=208348 RepID=A0ABY7D2E9_9BASI|nr:uncharacterized protein PtA15_15A185 [Puccinia triticina]WAQ91793.1 hypothetical protein PtA15_15A185 [Puccinia triticina]
MQECTLVPTKPAFLISAYHSPMILAPRMLLGMSTTTAIIPAPESRRWLQSPVSSSNDAPVFARAGHPQV